MHNKTSIVPHVTRRRNVKSLKAPIFRLSITICVFSSASLSHTLANGKTQVVRRNYQHLSLTSHVCVDMRREFDSQWDILGFCTWNFRWDSGKSARDSVGMNFVHIHWCRSICDFRRRNQESIGRECEMRVCGFSLKFRYFWVSLNIWKTF